MTERELAEARQRLLGPTEGASYRVECKASIDEISALGPERATAFMEGVAKVVAAFPYPSPEKEQSQMTTNRRSFIQTGAVAAGGLAFGAAFTAPACGKANLSGWVTSIVSAFGEIKPLLPQLGLAQSIVDRVSGFIDKAASIARSFDEAYKAGKFTDAVTLFSSLSGLVTQIAGELALTDNRIVKLALVAVSVARIAIASLLQTQADAQPQVAATVRSAKDTESVRMVNEIRRLAQADITKIEKALP